MTKLKDNLVHKPWLWLALLLTGVASALFGFWLVFARPILLPRPYNFLVGISVLIAGIIILRIINPRT